MTKIAVALAIVLTASACHEVNRAYCAALGDDSQKPWDDAPEWQKESAFNGVQFHIDNPSADASASHENWMKEKVAAGWVYGEKKDEEAKTHPCIVPFSELPKEQQMKDVLFQAVVHAVYPNFARVDEFDAQFESATKERDAAIAELAKVKTAAKSRVAPGEKPKKPRALGPIDDEKAVTGEALAAAIGEADKVEVAFSDGKKEIAGLPPIEIEGDVWKDHSRGRMLRDPVTIHGPQPGSSGYAIAGYALLLDGKQVAYTPRSDVINVAPGSNVNLADDIFFA